MITTTFQLDFRTFKRAPRKTGPKAHWLKQKKTCTPIHPFSVLRLLRRCKSDFYPFQTEEQTETGNSTQRARSHLSQPLLCPRRSPTSLPASSTPAESPVTTNSSFLSSPKNRPCLAEKPARKRALYFSDSPAVTRWKFSPENDPLRIAWGRCDAPLPS